MFKLNTRFDILWIDSLRNNELADKFSKTIDYDDWHSTPDLFKILVGCQTVRSSDNR